MDTISIKDYALLTGVTRQAVYKRLNTSLEQYCTKVLNPYGKDEMRLKIDVLTEEQKEQYRLLQLNKKQKVDNETKFKQAPEKEKKDNGKTETRSDNELLDLYKVQLKDVTENNIFLKDQITRATDTISQQFTHIERMQNTMEQMQKVIESQQNTIESLNQQLLQRQEQQQDSTEPVQNAADPVRTAEAPQQHGLWYRFKLWLNE